MEINETPFNKWWQERDPNNEQSIDVLVRGIALHAWYAGADWCLKAMQDEVTSTSPEEVTGGD